MKESVRNIGLSSYSLKWIALVTMAIDHMGLILFPQYPWMRAVGRIAFPIYCFLLTEGFFHTRDVKKYALRLGLFALASEIPFNLAMAGTFLYWQETNVFFTLLLGLLMLILWQYSQNAVWRIAAVSVCCLTAYWLKTDYNVYGVLLILIFYLMKDHPLWETVSIAVMDLFRPWVLQNFAVFAMAPIWLYNGKKGPGMKYFFYAFYPIHLLILFAVRNMMIVT